MKDCFDCQEVTCFKQGHDCIPYNFCLIDPKIDRFEKIKIIKKQPCNKCNHKILKEACKRCIHND